MNQYQGAALASPERRLELLVEAIRAGVLKIGYPEFPMSMHATQRWVVFCTDLPSSSKPQFWYCASDEQALLSLESGFLYHYPTEELEWASHERNVFLT
jgi:hypothetical protein